MEEKPIRVAIVGAGIAGSLLAYGLSKDPRYEVFCFEKVEKEDRSFAGTGLNVGPNALKVLSLFFPDVAESLRAVSLPWEDWTVSAIDGEPIISFPISHVADNPGIRLFWSELYRLCREPMKDSIIFASEVADAAYEGDDTSTLKVVYKDEAGIEKTLEGIDLLVAADGRYSLVRNRFFPPTPSVMAGLGICRVLVKDFGRDNPVGDFGQWFNGPNRMLGFRLPDGASYATATFPIEPRDAEIPESLKSPAAIRALFQPSPDTPIAPEVDYLLSGMEHWFAEAHWARFQESKTFWYDERGHVLLVGDASHAMLPTLGQGATQAVEDACVAADVLRSPGKLSAAEIPELLKGVEAERHPRVRFIADFSVEASDTLYPGCDFVAATKRKAEEPFLDKLRLLYRQVPQPKNI
ncbi:MAG: NAD(P)/FAD-dependent oxidoreductase [Verrucomicrobiota bacterium]